jgi:hypothetical protein
MYYYMMSRIGNDKGHASYLDRPFEARMRSLFTSLRKASSASPGEERDPQQTLANATHSSSSQVRQYTAGPVHRL